MDKGPWQAIPPDEGKSDWAVCSDDFGPDVALIVTGDFEDDAHRKAYCDWLAARLNGYDRLKVKPDAVDRFNVYGQRLDDHEPLGSAHFVRSSDYDALAAQRDELLALAHQYADECAECGGSGMMWTRAPDPQDDREIPCTACANVWAVIDRVEGGP